MSVSIGGMEGNGDSRQSWLSGDDCVVVFSSESSNLVQGDTNDVRDVIISINPLEGPPGSCQAPGLQ